MKNHLYGSKKIRWGMVSLFSLALVLGAGLSFFISSQAADVQDGLNVKIISAPNLVVDSNVTATSTYAPRVATVIGEFCNTGSSTLNNVTGNIGDFSANTPGFYPVRASDTGGPFDTQHPHLAGSGSYSFTHMGGSSDATRYMGSLAVGECAYQYWHFTYPACENGEEPPCSADPVWGATNNPNDDLWLNFDIWGTSTGSGTTSDNETHTATMRNEISAMANKIEPNGNPGGFWFNTDTSTVNPGETVTTNGILYRLGNINKGFDNDGDGVPDYNAWLQPFGDQTYDPSCFRLVDTTGVLTVTTNTGDVIIPFDNNLFFTDLPMNNTNVVGVVYYEFLALGGACTIPISPYQEAASGSDNEKFNGDYGSGPAPLQTFEPSVTMDKTGSPASGATGGRVDYTIGFENTSTQADAGIVLSSGNGGTISLVISDTVPTGMTYIGGSAAANNAVPVGYVIRYYDTSTSSWTTTEPFASNVSKIQWWLDEPLERAGTGSNSGTVTFAANLPGTAPTPPFIENCADGSFADAAAFATSCTVTMIQGSNTIGDFVWWDANSDGIQDVGELGIDGVTVSLYYDRNSDGALDPGDAFIDSQITSGGGAYDFIHLADGDFLVIVDDQATAITNNRLVPTTTTIYTVIGLGTTLPSDFNNADFGFGPVLEIGKILSSSNPAYEGQNIIFSLALTNTLVGDGTGQGSSCTFVTYGNNYDTSYTSVSGNGEWLPYTNAFGPNEPDGQFSASEYANANEDIGITEFAIGAQPGNVSSVDVLLALRVVNPGRFRPVAGESLDVEIIDATLGLAIHSVSISSTTLNSWSGTFVYEESIPSGVVSGMTVADFNSSRYTISLEANGGGGNNTDYDAFLELDAAGFQVTTDQTCGGPEDTIVTIPMTDEFDPSLFEFISAEPLPDSVTTGNNGDTYSPAGLINWNNLGPLYAGQTKIVTVTLKALEPSSNPENTINYARVRNAVFANGNQVNDGDANDDVDITPSSTIGDTIWNDNGVGGGTSGNGVQDGTESGLPGVSVSLTADRDVTINGVIYTTGSTILTDITDANGAYLFEGLPDAVYTVTVDNTSLPGMTATGGPHGITGSSAIVTVSSATVTTITGDGVPCLTNCELDVDFGYHIPNLIYGNIWEDNNGDASQQVGENGISTVTVYLCNSTPCDSGNATATTTTDSNGDYQFSIPTDGTYYLGVESSTGPVDVNSGWNNTVDPEGIPGDSNTNAISVSGGNIYGSYDFGYSQSGNSTIGDTLYADWNGDGDQDPGENGIDGVDVLLFEDSNGDGLIDPDTDALIASTVTANGTYTFNNLPGGNYIVQVDENELPWDSYSQTQDYDGTPDGQAEVALPDDTDLDTVDFGFQPVGYGSIGDYVWQDNNGNGLQDIGEPALPNITVELFVWNDDGDGIVENGEQGASIAIVDSGTDGSYLFDNLPVGDYIVDVHETDGPAGYVVSSIYDQDNDLTTPDVNNDPMGVSLSAGENFLDADFGFAPGGSIGDFIWQDNNGDGNWDRNEPGIDNVAVTLYNDVNGDGIYQSGTDTPHDSPTTTDSAGYYIFTNLPAGDYVVVVTSPGSNYNLTGDPDAYATGTTGAYPPYDPGGAYANLDGQYGTSLLGGRSDLTADFGYQPSAFVGDTVWVDTNGDGVVDDGESGIPFITVELRDGICTPSVDCQTTETDESGIYSFGNISDGNYVIIVDTGDTDWPANISTTNISAADPDGTADNMTNVTVNGNTTTIVGSCSEALGACALDADFGYQLNGSQTLSGTVFFDAGNDGGNYDSGDSPYEGVTVYLRDGNNILIGTTTTSVNGSYTFLNLPNDTYTVAIDTNSPQLTALTATREPDVDPCGVACDGNSQVLINGADSSDNDFGFYGSLDFGDLPDTYNSNPTTYVTNFANGGPYHSLGDVYLGSLIDAEADGVPSTAAASDDTTPVGQPNDEDGVNRVMTEQWQPNATVHLEISVTGTGGYLVGWFDFNGDGDFNDAGELIQFGNVPENASQLSLTLPSTYVTGTTINARFRLYDGPPAVISQIGGVVNGEVEDYQWPFRPNAVNLADFSADSGFVENHWIAVLLIVILLLGMGCFFMIHRKRNFVPIRRRDDDR